MDPRREKAEQILATGMITRQGHIFWVRSQSGKPRRSVILDGDTPTCDCADLELRQLPCKHIFAVQTKLEREQNGILLPNPPTVMYELGIEPSFSAKPPSDEARDVLPFIRPAR